MTSQKHKSCQSVSEGKVYPARIIYVVPVPYWVYIFYNFSIYECENKIRHPISTTWLMVPTRSVAWG